MNKRKSCLSISYISLIAILLVISFNIPSTYATGEQIKLIVNDREIYCDSPPTIINGRTLVPIRAIAENVNAVVEWDANTKTVILTRENTNIKLQIKNQTVLINNLQQQLDVPAQIINGRTMVPARFIAEAFGAIVEWNQNSNQVEIVTNSSATQVIALPPTPEPVITKITYSDMLIEHQLELQRIETNYLKQKRYIEDKIMGIKQNSSLYYGSESQYNQEITALDREIINLQSNINAMMLDNSYEGEARKYKLQTELNAVVEEKANLVASRAAQNSILTYENALLGVERQYQDDLAKEQTIFLQHLK